MIDPANVPSAAKALSPERPSALARADIDALAALRLPNRMNASAPLTAQ